MANTPFQDNVNAVLPTTTRLAAMPPSGNATAGKVPIFNGNGLLCDQGDPGGNLPTASVGFLHNDGSDNLAWQSPLPTDGYGTLINDGFGNLSWVEQYVANNTDKVYTVSVAGGGGQYHNIQAAVDAIQATGLTQTLFVISVYPGLYLDNNITIGTGFWIMIVANQVGNYPSSYTGTVELRYTTAPASGDSYIVLNPQASQVTLLSFTGITISHNAFATVTTPVNIFSIPSTTASSVVVTFYFTNCRIFSQFGNTDSTLFRSNTISNTGTNVYFSRSYVQAVYGSAPAIGSNGFIAPFYAATNKSCSIYFEFCDLSFSLSHASVPISYVFRLAGTSVSQTLQLYSCTRMWASGNSSASGVLKWVYTSGTGSVTATYCDIELYTAYSIFGVHFEGASGCSCTFIECSLFYLTPAAGGSVILVQSTNYAGGQLRVHGGTVASGPEVTILGVGMSYVAGSAFLPTVAAAENIVPASSYGLSVQGGTKPTFAREDHSHGTPPAILVGGSKITVNTSEPASPNDGDLYIDTN